MVILSHGFRQHRLGGDLSALGKTVTRDGANFTVIGILPPGFRFPLELEMRTKVALVTGPNVTIHGDADQLEQLLILLCNAVDAALETGGGMDVGRTTAGEIPGRVGDQRRSRPF